MNSDHKKLLGTAGEDLAVDLLHDAGYDIINRNWRDGRRGELDIIAAGPLGPVIVEVRTRVGTLHGSPLESITPDKLRRLRTLAAAWLRVHELPGKARIDIIAITIDWEKRHDLAAQCESGTLDLDVLDPHIQWIEGVS